MVLLLSKTIEVLLKNAKHKITNKLKAGTLFFFSMHFMHYIRLLKAYVMRIGQFWQGKFFNSPAWNRRGQGTFMWLPRIWLPPWCSPKITRLRCRSPWPQAKKHIIVFHHNLTYKPCKHTSRVYVTACFMYKPQWCAQLCWIFCPCFCLCWKCVLFPATLCPVITRPLLFPPQDCSSSEEYTVAAALLPLSTAFYRVRK